MSSQAPDVCVACLVLHSVDFGLKQCFPWDLVLCFTSFGHLFGFAIASQFSMWLWLVGHGPLSLVLAPGLLLHNYPLLIRQGGASFICCVLWLRLQSSPCRCAVKVLRNRSRKSVHDWVYTSCLHVSMLGCLFQRKDYIYIYIILYYHSIFHNFLMQIVVVAGGGAGHGGGGGAQRCGVCAHEGAPEGPAGAPPGQRSPGLR